MGKAVTTLGKFFLSSSKQKIQEIRSDKSLCDVRAGNYFVAGGSVEGERIIGQYPEMLQGGNMAFEPGILIVSNTSLRRWIIHQIPVHSHLFSSHFFNSLQLHGKLYGME